MYIVLYVFSVLLQYLAQICVGLLPLATHLLMITPWASLINSHWDCRWTQILHWLFPEYVLKHKFSWGHFISNIRRPRHSTFLKPKAIVCLCYCIDVIFYWVSLLYFILIQRVPKDSYFLNPNANPETVCSSI